MWFLRCWPCALVGLLLAIVGVSITGCSASDPNDKGNQGQTSTSQDLIPLDLGNRWVYLKTTKDEKGTVIDHSEAQSRVVGVHRFGGETWYCVDEFGLGIWTRNSADGQLKADVSFDASKLFSVNRTELYFKYPANVGDSWKLNTGEPDGLEPQDEQTIKVVKVDHPTKVRAGEFSCVVYEHVEYGTRFYMASGTGIVKYEYPTGLLGDGNSEVFELTKFERAGD